MTMKSSWKAATVLVASVLILSACSAPGGSGGTVHLEFQTGLGSSDPILKDLTTITKSFEAANHGVDIKLVPMTNTYEADMKVRLSSHDLPDIWATHGWSLLRYSDFLEPLNKQPWASNFNKALAPAMENSKGQFFALPVDTDVAGIVYNKTVLAAAGIDPATLTTWDAFTAAAAKLKATGIAPITSSGKDSWFAGNIADFLSSGAHSPAELKKLRSGTFASPAYEKMLDQVSDWTKAGYFNPDYSSATQDDIARALAQGKTGFVFVQNYIVAGALALNPDAKLGYFPIPGFVGKPYLVGGEGHAYGVAKTSPHKDVALKYLAYLAKPKNLSSLASAIGGVPGLTNATSDLGVLSDSYKQFVAPNAFRLEPYFDRVYLPNGMWDTMVKTTDSVITKQSDPAAATAQMKAQFTTLFKPE
jgi:raffinose/stachyose/melibiose transport system substrate-binding protein